MYQALYRKYRPQTFSDVVGQKSVTDTLRAQLETGRLSHAYLFTGTRGTGKTSCAKILAKAVNCENPNHGDPCGVCPSCRAIDEGSCMDVLEIDAASNNGVDSVRVLRDDAIYTPGTVKMRVYIIDEVHMLSTAAFNALLKIIEEPPEHLLFILATTELHKVPATILSRCQRFSFKRILPQDIARQLLYIAGEERIDLSPDGADILARMANGAMRDALSLLDQCRSFEGTLNSAAILELLGLAGGVQTAQLMEFILRRSTQDALLHFDRLYRDGKDIAALLRELSDLGRDLLIRRTAPQGGAALLTGLYDENTLTGLGELASGHRLIYLLDVLGQTQTALNGSGSLRTEAELCLMKLCDESLCGDLSALTARLERLEKAAAKGLAVPISATPAAPAAPQTQTPPPAPAAPARTESPAPTAPASPKPEPMADPAPQAQAPKSEPITPVPQPEASPAGGDSGIWDRLKEHYKAALRVDKRVFLNGASGTLSDGVLTVVCRDEMVKNYLDCPEVNEVLCRVTEKEAGCPVRLVFTLGTVQKSEKHHSTPSAPKQKNTTPPAPEGISKQAQPHPEQIPPWESAPAGTDRMNELLVEGDRLDNFNIK